MTQQTPKLSQEQAETFLKGIGDILGNGVQISETHSTLATVSLQSTPRLGVYCAEGKSPSDHFEEALAMLARAESEPRAIG